MDEDLDSTLALLNLEVPQIPVLQSTDKSLIKCQPGRSRKAKKIEEEDKENCHVDDDDGGDAWLSDESHDQSLCTPRLISQHSISSSTYTLDKAPNVTNCMPRMVKDDHVDLPLAPNPVQLPATPLLSKAEMTTDDDMASDEASRDISTSSSDWFNTTREEMILYEKFGENYDLEVEKMTRQEKIQLRQEIAHCEPKSAHELLDCSTVESCTSQDDMHNISVNENQISSSTQEPQEPLSTVPRSSPEEYKKSFSTGEEKNDQVTVTKKPPVPLPRSVSPKKKDTGHHLKPQLETEKSVAKRPVPVLHSIPSYLRPTSSSRQKASARKCEAFGWTKTGETNQFCLNSNYCNASPSMKATFAASSPVQLHKKSSVVMSTVLSPVAQYIHTNTVPKVIRSIKPKSSKHFEDELLALQQKEMTEHAGEAPTKKRVIHSNSIPDVEYKSSKVALQKKLETESPVELPKRFASPATTEAVVIRHLPRERVPLSSVKQSLHGAPIAVELANESSVDMSIIEVKKIKKITCATPKKA